MASNESLAEMEKWSTREKETSQYSIVLSQEDAAWMLTNYDKNQEALETMRSLIPTRVSEMSLREIEEFVKANGGLYTPELIAEIKTNKLLHWLVCHTDDIALSNFLSGEHRQYFVNLEGLDVLELRALRLVLPDKFELDSDGAKAEWRERFVSRVKQLVAQENGDMIKGGWDADMGKRAMVRLPPLKKDQIRRSVYHYRTKVEMEKRLKQYDDKDLLLEKKQGLLEKALTEAAEMRAEYDTVLEETRDPGMKALYGAEKLAVAKDCAKRDWQTAERRKNELNMEVSRLRKAIESNPVSRDAFVTFMSEQEAYLSDRNWADSEESILIAGVFERNPDIKKVERTSAKFISAEQEALQRKQELTKISSSSGAAPGGVSEISAVADSSAEIIVGTSEADGSCGGEEVKASGQAPIDTYRSMIRAAADTSTQSARPSGFVPSRRNSVLQKANPEMLQMLNSMLSSSAAPAALASGGLTPVKRRTALGTVAVTPSGQDAPTTPVEAKPIRSRNLKVCKLVLISITHSDLGETLLDW